MIDAKNEIYRAKALDGDTWRIGYLFYQEISGTNITMNGPEKYEEKFRYRIIPSGQSGCLPRYVSKETIGKFTGELDINNKQIFSDDVVKLEYETNYGTKTRIGVICYGQTYTFEVDSSHATLIFGFYVKWKNGNSYTEDADLSSINDFEVIGNIHDNKELFDNTK